MKKIPWYKKTIKYLKNLFRSFFIRLSLSLSKIEKNLLNNSKGNDFTGDSNEIRNIENDILKSLYNGEYNKEYVNKFYKILKKADQIIYDKYDFTEEDFFKRTDMEDSKEVSIIDMITNKVEIKNAEDILFGSTPIKVTTLKSNNENRIFKIEEICDFLHVKKYNKGDEFLLEFYINIIHDSTHFENEIKKLTNIYYIDKYGDKKEFNNLKFNKKTKFNHYNVFKFKSK